jgi:hypothetical protein
VALDYLNHLPAYKQTASCLEYSSLATIETAIRAQDHVLEAGQAEILPQAEAVVGQVNVLVGQVLKNQLTDETLKVLAENTGDFLEASGLISSRSNSRVKMATMLQLAWQHDKLNRVNQGATRFRLRSAYLMAVKQMVFSGKVAKKYALNKTQLEYERAVERWALSETVTALERRVLWDAAFESEGSQTDTQRRILSGLITEIDQNLLTLVRVKPYLKPARVVSLALVGSPPERQALEREIIDDGGKFDWLINQLPVKKMIEANHFAQAGKRINQLNGYLQQVLTG